jgi:hypothetical protein
MGTCEKVPHPISNCDCCAYLSAKLSFGGGPLIIPIAPMPHTGHIDLAAKSDTVGYYICS